MGPSQIASDKSAGSSCQQPDFIDPNIGDNGPECDSNREV